MSLLSSGIVKQHKNSKLKHLCLYNGTCLCISSVSSNASTTMKSAVRQTTISTQLSHKWKSHIKYHEANTCLLSSEQYGGATTLKIPSSFALTKNTRSCKYIKLPFYNKSALAGISFTHQKNVQLFYII